MRAPLKIVFFAAVLAASQAVAATREGTRATNFLQMHSDSSLPADSEPGQNHERWCMTGHPVGDATDLLVSMQAALDGTSGDEDHQAFFELYEHTLALLQGPKFAPAGICATLRAGLEGAKEATSYATAAKIMTVSYATVLDVPGFFLGDPKTALGRGLRIAREHSREMDPVDRRLVLKGSLKSFSQCRELTPHPFYWAIMVGAGDMSIIPEPDEGADILEAVSAAVALSELTPETMAYFTPMEARRAATTDKGRYWSMRVLTDRLVQSGRLEAAAEEILKTARDKAFPLPLDQGVAVFEAAYRELAK